MHARNTRKNTARICVYEFTKVVIEGHCLLLVLMFIIDMHIARCWSTYSILECIVLVLLAVAASIIADNKCNLIRQLLKIL